MQSESELQTPPWFHHNQLVHLGPFIGTQRAPFVLAGKSAGKKQKYARLHAQVDSVVAFQESDTPSGGWGGTDRFGALYECRVIHSEPVNARRPGRIYRASGGAAGSKSAMTFAVQVNILSMTNRRSEALTPEP
jgi:hypothetical protein